MLILFLASYLALNLLILKFKPKIIINDIYWLLSSWGFILGLYFTSGFSYYYYLKKSTIIYIVFVILVYICFRTLGCKVKIKKSIVELNKKNRNEKKINTKPLFYLSLFGLFLRVFDLIRLNSLSFGVKVQLSSSVIGVIGSFFTPLGIVLWIYELVWALRYKTKPPIRAFFSLCIYIIPVIIISGRINILNILIASIVATVYTVEFSKKKEDDINFVKKRSKFNKLLKPLFLLGMLGIVYYSIFLAENRYGSNLVGMFEYAGRSKISSDTLNIINKFGVLGGVFLNLLHYYTHQLSTLEIIFSFYDGPYLFGMHQLHYLSRRLPKFLQLDSFLVDASFKNIVYNLGAPGLGSAWKTAIGSFIFDFGRIGTVLFVAVLGFLVGQKRRLFISSRSVYETVFQVLICVGAFFSIHYSPFYETSWAYALFWMIIIPFLTKFKIKEN